jgi:predicted GH43/DUF377 family glycosyl hydrolase
MVKFLFLSTLIVGLLLTGCTQQAQEKVATPPDQETPVPSTPTIQQPPPPSRPNPFISASPELKACLQQALGEESFNALVSQERRPTSEEEALIESCLQQFGFLPSPLEQAKTTPKTIKLKWESGGIVLAGNYADPEVVKVNEKEYRMYFGKSPESLKEGERPKIYSAISSDGITWREETGIRLEFATFPDVIKLPDGRWRMYFQSAGEIKSAISNDGLTWQVEPGVRIGQGGHNNLDDYGVGASTTVRLNDGSYLMVYRTEKHQKFCEFSPNPSSFFLFYAVSKDGLNFEKKGLVFDSRNDIFCDLLDGPELVLWDDGSIHLFFWSHKGVYESIFENETFSEPELVFPSVPGNPPPADPTVIKVKDKWFMYYGQHQKGIFYAIYS